jgi:hypothetical protein
MITIIIILIIIITNHSIEGKIILIQKVTNQTKMWSGNKNVITKNYIHRTLVV